MFEPSITGCNEASDSTEKICAAGASMRRESKVFLAAKSIVMGSAQQIAEGRVEYWLFEHESV